MAKPYKSPELGTPLTRREADVYRQLLTGKTNLEIGETLFISVKSVKFHLVSIYKKTGTKNRSQLIARSFGATSESNDLPGGTGSLHCPLCRGKTL